MGLKKGANAVPKISVVLILVLMLVAIPYLPLKALGSRLVMIFDLLLIIFAVFLW